MITSTAQIWEHWLCSKGLLSTHRVLRRWATATRLFGSGVPLSADEDGPPNPWDLHWALALSHDPSEFELIWRALSRELELPAAPTESVLP